MRLALIGKSIAHSRSPYLYSKILGPQTTYELIDVDKDELPSLANLVALYDGVNITSPYKEKYFDQVIVTDSLIQSLGAINTIDLRGGTIFATNTDLLAVRKILNGFLARFSQIHIILLGTGVMARIVSLVSNELGINVTSIGRKQYPDMSTLNLGSSQNIATQTLIINACSRDFIFQGSMEKSSIFWDLNYNFMPHQNTLPLLVKEYHDGQEMLFLQAQAAVEFWQGKK